MKFLSRLLSIAILSTHFFIAQAFAQVQPFSEEFDSVTAPALPAGWISASLVGAQNAVTSTAFKVSTPNAAFLPNPGSISKTGLVTKTYSIITSLPTTTLDVSFKHKRGMESTFDGGILEISINGGAFVDVKDPTVNGVFSSGGYNGILSLNFNNPLKGRQAWTGDSANFESVSLQIPNIADNSTVQFRFVIGTDSSVGDVGWFIDNFEVTAAADISTVLTPLSSEIAPGGQVVIDNTFINPTSFNAINGVNYVSTSGKFKSVSFVLSGFYQRIGNWLGYLGSSESIPSLETSTSNMVVTDVVGQAGAKLKILTTATSQLVNISTGLTFLSSSQTIPSGLLTGEIVFSPIDPCQPPGVLGYPVTNRIVIWPGQPTCTYGQAALALQSLGAKAVILQAPPPGTFDQGNFPRPFVTEAATPGLTIPTFTYDPTPFSPIFTTIGAPGTSTASIEGNNSAELRTLYVASWMPGGNDPVQGNNDVTALIKVVTDVDGDGTPDIRDACKNDNRKVVPGVCGCGNVDQDLNGNSVFDCLISSDFKAQVASLKNLVSKLKFTSKNFKSLKKQIKSFKGTALSLGINNPGSISALGGANISALTKKADKSVSALLRAATDAKVKSARKVAIKDIGKLIAGIAG